MKDWVNKNEVSRALSIVLSKRFNLMTVMDIMDDLSNATREEALKTKADIGRDMAKRLSEKIFYIKHEDAVIPVVDWHDVVDILEEREQGESKKDCYNCANSVDDFCNEVDTGCYMCCKGFENNYVPINAEMEQGE